MGPNTIIFDSETTFVRLSSLEEDLGWNRGLLGPRMLSFVPMLENPHLSQCKELTFQVFNFKSGFENYFAASEANVEVGL